MPVFVRICGVDGRNACVAPTRSSKMALMLSVMALSQMPEVVGRSSRRPLLPWICRVAVVPLTGHRYALPSEFGGAWPMAWNTSVL